VDWKQMVDRAKQELDKRGGPQSAKEDAEELRDIAQGEGTMTDKLRRVAAAIKEPGAHEPDAQPTAGRTPGAQAPGVGDPGASDSPPASGPAST
jgi:hypothetical protein